MAAGTIERTAYTGRHRGQARPVIQVTEQLANVEGLWRQVSLSTGTTYWSADGNTWLASPVAMGAHHAV
jgi:hypothetical protein